MNKKETITVLKEYALNNLYYRFHNGAGYNYRKLSLEDAEAKYLDWLNNYISISKFAEYYRMELKDANKFIDDYRSIRNILYNN